jgi:hypothetical protein
VCGSSRGDKPTDPIANSHVGTLLRSWLPTPSWGQLFSAAIPGLRRERRAGERRMTDDQSPIEHLPFDSNEDALRFLKERADDIANVAIPIGGPVAVLHKGKTLGPYAGIGMIVFMVSGDIHLLKPSRAELTFNDGFLARMRIRISLLTGEQAE